MEQTHEVYGVALTVLSNDADGNLEKLLENIVEWEKNHPAKNEYDGWSWFDVGGDARTLNKLAVIPNQILKVVFKSNKSCGYRALDVAGIEKALADYEGTFKQEETEATEQIPEGLFNIITGHEDKKEIVMRSLQAEKPVHMLLYGTPASAKTLFLEELARLPQNRFILGSSLTKAGLFDVLYNERPRYLIIDELDKIDDSENLSALLSLMHKGYITETKYRRHRTLRLKTWVFASANEIMRLPRELMSRFLRLRFNDYTDDEFREVSVDVLREQENVPESLALYIAERVLRDLLSRDIRDCVKVSRLLKNKNKAETDKIIEILSRQK